MEQQNNLSTFSYKNCLLPILRDNIHELIDQFYHHTPNNVQSKKIQMRLVNLTCINYGREFIVEVFHYIMNLSLQSSSITVLNYQQPKLNNQFIALLNSLRIESGGLDVYDCIKDTVDLNERKTLNYWANLMLLLESKPINIEISTLIGHLIIQKNDCYNINNNNNNNDNDDEWIIRINYILKIFLNIFEHFNEFYKQQQYRLSVSLINIYFDLMALLNNDHRLTIIIDCLVICERFLINLSKSLPINECIILRCLLDFIRNKSYLFDDYNAININDFDSFNDDDDEQQWSTTSLLNVNITNNNHHHHLKVKKSTKFNYYNSSIKKKRCYQNKNSAFNKLLLMDLIENCVTDSKMFAELFINSLSNQLLLRDAPILDEDPRDGQIQHVRMTFETDLHVYRLFNQNPILWNILQLLSEKKCLNNCLVIVRSIINVLRTNLISSTFHENHLLDAQRFIWTLANDEMLPKIAFSNIPEIISEQIKPFEVAFILHDIARYIRDNNARNGDVAIIRPYLNRLRLILAHKRPNDLYIKIFQIKFFNM